MDRIEELKEQLEKLKADHNKMVMLINETNYLLQGYENAKKEEEEKAKEENTDS